MNFINVVWIGVFMMLGNMMMVKLCYDDFEFVFKSWRKKKDIVNKNK